MNLKALSDNLTIPLSECFPGHQRLRIELLCQPKSNLDDTTKLLVLNGRNVKIAVVLVSSQAEPEIAIQNADRARSIVDYLPRELGAAVLLPKAVGQIGDRTYAVYQFYRPMSESRIRRRIHRRLLRPALLDWLLKVASVRDESVEDQGAESAFIDSLESLSFDQGMPDSVREGGRLAKRRIQQRKWKPKFIVMHGDFWEGNFLFGSRKLSANQEFRPPVMIIDWPGSLVKGYAMFDLIRLSISMNLPHQVLCKQIVQHCDALGCDAEDSKSYLLASLGYLGQNLGCFPHDQYVCMATKCLGRLEDSLCSKFMPPK